MGAFFNGILQSMLVSFGIWVSTAVRRAPLTAAFFSASFVIIGTYLTAMNTLVAGLEVTIPETVLKVWGWVMPSNVAIILSAIYGAKIAKWAHYKLMKALSIKIKALSS